MHRQHAVLLATIAAIAFFLAPLDAIAQDPYGRDGEIVRCESRNGGSRQCPVDARGGARLLRQLSRGPCIEGQTWRALRDAIWVGQGCRGEFLAIAGRAAPRERDERLGESGMLRCGSVNGRWTHCPTEVRGGIELVRQLSRSACVRGQSWGTDARGIWVNGGCRGDFRVGARRDWQEPAQRIRCESVDGATRRCRLDARGPVRLVRQLSRTACVEGQNWGRDRDALWVMGGCRAEFEALPRTGQGG